MLSCFVWEWSWTISGIFCKLNYWNKVCVPFLISWLWESSWFLTVNQSLPVFINLDITLLWICVYFTDATLCKKAKLTCNSVPWTAFCRIQGSVLSGRPANKEDTVCGTKFSITKGTRALPASSRERYTGELPHLKVRDRKAEFFRSHAHAGYVKNSIYNEIFKKIFMQSLQMYTFHPKMICEMHKWFIYIVLTVFDKPYQIWGL